MSRAVAALVIAAAAMLPAELGDEGPAEAPAAKKGCVPAAVKTEVRGVAVDARSNSPVVVLASTDEAEFLPIFIGPAEAAAIWRYLHHAEAPRPMTHDLLAAAIEKLGGTLRKVTVTELKKGTFYARIEIAVGEKVIEVDARPSDAIALALKTKTDIYVAKEVMKQAGRPNPGGKEPPGKEGPQIDLPPEAPSAI